MKKNILRALIISVIAILSVFVLTSCIDDFGRPADYVEVEKLTIDSANVYLSPSGVTSTYQLNVHILPENASNVKLDYYVPSEYMPYLRVSEQGLLSATGQVTPEGVRIPVKVTSTTNKNAYLTVNVTVEYVAVSEINFDPKSVTLLLSENYQMEPIFVPYHAQDGRTVSYRSLNEEVATVSSSGLVHPVKAGTTRILCESSTASGKTITGRLEVHVVYAPGRYRLEVSDSNPQYNQVLGDFKAIHFSLMSLDPNSDPDIRIQWYVDSKRVVELGLDSRQYEHIPNVNSRTSYRIKVVIDPSKETPYDGRQVLESELITIYGRFQGFDLTYGNLETDLQYSYRYGDEATFVLTEGQSSVVAYNWYLKRKNSATDGVFIARTEAQDRNLTRRLNIEGDFTLTAKAVDAEGREGTSKDFDFTVTRFIAGDTLVVKPVLTDNGTPPETYNYFLTRCDENGEVSGDPTAIGYSSHGEIFNYTVNQSGNYIITANATLNGVVATVPVNTDGKVTEKEFTYKSEIFRFFPSDEADNKYDNDIVKKGVALDKFGVNNEVSVTDISISGIYDGEYKVLLRWNAPLGAEDITVEIKKGDEVIVINGGAGFGNRSFVFPTETVTLNDEFSVRIKADGGLFSHPYYYGIKEEEGKEEFYFAAVHSSAYPYLEAVDGVTTRYIVDMRELGELLKYVTDYTPTDKDSIVTRTESIDGVMSKVMKFDVKFGFDLAEADNYFDGVVPEGYPQELTAAYKAIVGAQSVFCATGKYGFEISALDDGGYSVTVIIPDDRQTTAVETAERNVYVSPSYSKTPYLYSEIHEIDSRKQKTVGTSEQLFGAVAAGYRPAFTDDGTRNLYNKAVGVINSILDGGMTEREKVLAIYDYLVLNVTYDYSTAENIETNGLYNSAAYRLEGVFDYNRAVCDGISKAFVLLCAIEGIRSERITGTVDGKPHAWNKVCVDGNYYVVDCTAGIFLSDGKQVIDHKYFLISDEEYFNTATRKEYGKNPVCLENGGYYDGIINGSPVTVTNREELAALLGNFGTGAAPVVLEIKFDVNYVDGKEAGEAEITAAYSGTAQIEIVYLGENRFAVII